MLWLSGSNLETKLYPDCVVAKIVGLEQNVERWFDFCKAPMEVIGIDPVKPALITWVSTPSCCYQWQDCQGFRSVFISAVSSGYCGAVTASQRNAVQMCICLWFELKKNIEKKSPQCFPSWNVLVLYLFCTWSCAVKLRFQATREMLLELFLFVCF